MLFNSFIFILLFLPVTLLGTFFINRYISRRAAIIWLLSASLFYYGYDDHRYTILIIMSMAFNYIVGSIIVNDIVYKGRSYTKTLLIFGVACNLALLGYFKYANFFIENIDKIFNIHAQVLEVLLPIGISFYTFQQIAYLVDSYRKLTKGYNLFDYCLFVVFFPQLIAGPIVHHKEMITQFKNKQAFKFLPENFSEGFSMFSIGLLKKVILADGIAQYANPVFNYAGTGGHVSFLVAWLGALAYTFQIYFDFSGYSDMAIGLGRMLGVRLPVNFNSPYKANNIIDFWRRWNMTLSRFLKEYLYFALGGNRKGKLRRYINLMLTMILGGLWHGASWTFVFWGGLHGAYLCVNHAWVIVKKQFGMSEQSGQLFKMFSKLITFLSVVIAWVFFRASTFSSAFNMIKGMFGFNGLALPTGYSTQLYFGAQELVFIAILFLIILFLPNSQQFVSKNFLGKVTDGNVLSAELAMNKVNIGWAILFSLAFVFCLLFTVTPASFIYFRF